MRRVAEFVLLPLFSLSVLAFVVCVALMIGEMRGRTEQRRLAFLYQQRSEILSHYWRTGQRYPENIIAHLDSLIAEERYVCIQVEQD